ncbi:MAG TPA: hypothetical protein VK991_06225 [Halomonas sp.]|nr:hypothetical protein [Halomonas sp.]
MRMQGKNVVVTGGASGIGLASVERCLQEGASFVTGAHLLVDGGFTAGKS